MNDSFGRTIEYIRLSVTDRCNLRCTYCMPEGGIALMEHRDILSYEEMLRIVKIMAGLGIKKVRLTGGEPLVRKNLAALVAGLKAIDGIETVALTTNGTLLSQQLPALMAAGLDGVNISLDALEEDVFFAITRRHGADCVLRAIDDALSYPSLKVKINCVPTEKNRSQLLPMAQRFLSDPRLSLRFIELMPIGIGGREQGCSEQTLIDLFSAQFGSLSPLPHSATDGPCSYYAAPSLPGRLGLISAMSHCFCAQCNRIRLTSGGFLKTCLQYDTGVFLRPLLEKGDRATENAIREAIQQKPERHHFSQAKLDHGEQHIMSQIGG